MDKCNCSMSIRMLGDGCRHCQPQEHIDRLGEWLEDERVELAQANATIEGLEKSLGVPYPPREILSKLIEATTILLDEKNYDGHGWEVLQAARDAALNQSKGE